MSDSLDTGFFIEALAKALEKGKPLVFNTDQGSQFTSNAWSKCRIPGRPGERGIPFRQYCD